MESADELAAISALLAQGDERGAFANVCARLAWPIGRALGRTSGAEVGAWIAMLGTLALQMGAPKLHELTEAVVRDPDSPDRLYDLGFALIDAGLPLVAATVLWRCLSLVGDSEEVMCELVSALETATAYEDAFHLLDEREALRASSFLCSYLYAFDAAMTGRLEVVRETVGSLVPSAPAHEVMRATIEAIIERADRVTSVCALDRADLRGWHYVLTGGLLLHRSPYGFPAPMHGRYAWLQDSYALIATGLDRLRPFVAGLPCIYAPEGRDHEIVARAAAQKFGLPVAPWPAIGVPAPGLIVAHRLEAIPPDALAALAHRKADQVFYAHASPWTYDSRIAPDLTMCLYQTLNAPWDVAHTYSTEPGQAIHRPADDRPAEVIAAEIVASAGIGEAETGADDLAGWDVLVARAWPLGPGPRTRLWAGGPVPSNRF
ncbi:hypothetical protein BH11MYX1_BH11MYX1_41280 [soil metagenome]